MNRIENIKKYANKLIPEFEVKISRKDNTAINHAEEIIKLNPDEDFSMVIDHMEKVHGAKFIKKYDPLFVAMLHEVGHYMTFDFIDDSEYEIYMLMVTGLQLATKEYNNFVQLSDAYFNTTVEWEATEWALNYISENQKNLKEFLKNS